MSSTRRLLQQGTAIKYGNFRLSERAAGTADIFDAKEQLEKLDRRWNYNRYMYLCIYKQVDGLPMANEVNGFKCFNAIDRWLFNYLTQMKWKSHTDTHTHRQQREVYTVLHVK